MDFRIYDKYKKSYYIEKEKQLTPFFCYKCLCFHFYSLSYTDNYKTEINPGCPNFKKSISLKIFLDYGLSLFSNLIQCTHCNLKFLSDPKTKFSYCKECKSYICHYCLNNNSHNDKHFIISLKDIGLFCFGHNKKYKYSCSKCNKNICETCYKKFHKKHNYIFDLNSLDIKDYDFIKEGYIQKPKNINQTYQDLKFAKKYTNEVSDKNKIKNFIAKMNEIERNFISFETSNYLLYLIVLKLYFKFFKNNQKEDIVPFELENNLKCFFSYDNYYSFYYDYRYEIYETIKSSRKLTQKEKEYKNYTQSSLKYCISPFTASPNAKISIFSKNIGELYWKNDYGRFEKYDVKLLLKNKLLFIFIVIISNKVDEDLDDDDDYNYYECEEAFYYLIDTQSLEDKSEKDPDGLKNIFDICEYKKNIIIGINSKEIKIFDFQNYKFTQINKMDYDEPLSFDILVKINSLPNNKILAATKYGRVLLLSVQNNNQLILEKKYILKYGIISDVLILQNLEEAILLDKRKYRNEYFNLEQASKYVNINPCKLIFNNYNNFQVKSILRFQIKIISLIQLNKELICALSANEIYIINANNKKIMNKQKYNYTFEEIYKMDQSKFMCYCEDKYKNLYLIFDYNRIKNKISCNPLNVVNEDFSFSNLIYILEKQKIFIYIDRRKDKISLKKYY